MRVSWLFSAHGQNFLQMMLRLGATQPVLKVVDDQRARPTASGDVAAFILSQGERLAEAPAGAREWGLLHVVNDGVASRYDMARAIFALARPDAPPAMEPVPTSAFPTPARRALNAVLDTGRMQEVFSLQLRPWQEALEDVMGQLSDPKETA
jgi:dTDP-4-dehydrorhamnose reductase